MTGTTFSAGTGATFNAPSLVDVSGSRLSLDSSFTFITGPLGNIDNTRLFIGSNKNFNAVSATSYTGHLQQQ